MLNKDGQRELCYVVNIDAIEPIVGSDNCEAAVVGGWRVMVRKNTFAAGDKAVYFEIDSKVPETEVFAFLAKKHYKIKTQKYTFGGKNPGFYSQGLLMSFADFGWELDKYKVGDFLTKELGVVYYDPTDNKRKSNGVNKYKKMAQQRAKLFKHQPFRFLMRRAWGRKLLFFFFGNKKSSSDWPQWIKKTDEERVQNIPWILSDTGSWIVTEKVDGTSTTFAMKRERFGKNKFYVCSRNVVFDTPDKNCFYSTNVYLEMAQKYNVEDVMTKMLQENPKLDWIYIQGETYGAGIQKRDYSIKDHDFAAFNVVTSDCGRWNSITAKDYLAKFEIPFVPILDEEFSLPDSVDEILSYVEGTSVYDGKPREGCVFRDSLGEKSFKGVSNSFLMKYHG